MPTTEVDIMNRALAKNHVLEEITSSDGTIANATSTGLPTTLAKRFYSTSRQQILRLAPWTCVQRRKQLASQLRAESTAYLLGDLVLGLHSTIYSVYKCTVAGTTGSGSVTWPTSGTVTDGTVTWTYQYDVLSGLADINFTGYAYNFPLPSDYINQIEVTDTNGQKVEFQIENTWLFCDINNAVLIYVPDETNPSRWDPLLAEAITMQIASAVAYPLTGSHENEIAFAQASMQIVAQAAAKAMREKQQGQMRGDEWFPGLFPNAPKQ